MPLIYTADPSLSEQDVKLLTHSRSSIDARIVDVPIVLAFDVVVQSIADLPAPVGGFIDLTTGSWAFAAAVDVGTDTVRVPAGVEVLLVGLGWDKVLSGDGPVLDVRGTAIVETLAVVSTVGRAVTLESATAVCRMLQCSISAAATCIGVTLGAELECIGGLWTGAAWGLLVDGTIPTIRLVSTHIANAGAGVLYNAGVVGGAVFQTCYFDANAIGINWAAASLPNPRGLIIDGCDFTSVISLNGFNELSPNANVKASLDLAGIMLETPIFPGEWDHVVRTLADFPAPVASVITLTSGSWAIAEPIAMGVNELLVPVGTTVFLKGLGPEKTLTSGGTPVLDVRGTAIVETLGIVGSALDVVGLNNAAARVVLTECSISGPSRLIDVQAGGAALLRVQGGVLIGDGTTEGVRLAGALPNLQLIGVEAGTTVTPFVQDAGSATQAALIQGCVVKGAIGIAWPAANMASRGLSVVGNWFNGATPFSGFTAADARVNAKANIGSAGLLSETAIVP